MPENSEKCSQISCFMRSTVLNPKKHFKFSYLLRQNVNKPQAFTVNSHRELTIVMLLQCMMGNLITTHAEASVKMLNVYITRESCN